MACSRGRGYAIRKSGDKSLLVGGLIVTVNRVRSVELRHGGGKQRANQQ